ncbi:hypothetical protein, partial [Agrobacterium rosae]|uniref:hypothetical protein n=1 Tax=Agrobacterium rosae TaxID=1972867 RepID=UPI003BA01E64
WRLFGFDGTADAQPGSATGLVSLRGFGLTSATAQGIKTPKDGEGKLQGGERRTLRPASFMEGATGTLGASSKPLT